MATKTPTQAVKAGNRVQVGVAKQTDPVFLAFNKWNQQLVLAGATPSGTEEPLADGRGYTIAGQVFCRPFVKVRWLTGMQSGPDVRFVPRDDGLYLTVVMEEDFTKRVANAKPFDVRVKSVQLRFGDDASSMLNFPEPLQEPLTEAGGPAFRVEAGALVPEDERQARLVAAMQAGGAKWLVRLEFQWLFVPPPPSPPPPLPPPPVGPRPPVAVRPLVGHGTIRPHVLMNRPGVMVRPREGDPSADTAAGDQALSAKTITAQQKIRPEVMSQILVARIPAKPVQPQPQLKTLIIDRELSAHYPKDAAHNLPIYAAVDKEYGLIGWKNTGAGWFQPTPIQDTVYCLPDAYRLAVDDVTGLPAIKAVLLRKNDAGELVDDLDPRHYKVRLTLKVKPDFDPARLASLRALIRAQSAHQIEYADLVLGGYGGARFQPDASLTGLGELFGGASAGQQAVNPEETFTLTYEGSAEFADLLFTRLKADGIEGDVEIDLKQPGGTTTPHKVPVSLTLRRLAPVSVPWALVLPPPPSGDALREDDGSVDALTQLPRELTLRNTSQMPVTLAGVQAHALQKSPVTGRVDDWFPADAAGPAWPLTLAPGASQKVTLQLEEADALFNTWDVALLDSKTVVGQEIVLNQLFDAATSGVRGWKVQVDSPPLAFFDQLSPEDQARVRDIAAIEVEMRRLGSNVIEEVRLTRAKPEGVILLSRTVGDFVSDRATGRSTFEYRQRILRLTRAEEWTPWRQETGSALTVFLS